MTGYRIEKQRRRVTVTTISGESLEGDIFLQPYAGRHPGPETPLDVLTNGDAFFPLLLPDGDTRLIANAGVANVRWPSAEEPDDDRAALAQRASIQVRLLNGSTYEGTILVEVPSRHARMLDYLNFHSDRFISIANEGANLSINRQMVESIRQLD